MAQESYDKILVPLDGSTLAETILPHVGLVATGCRTRQVTFLRVVEPVVHTADRNSAPEWEIVKRMDNENKRVAQAYLDELIARIRFEDVHIVSEVVGGNPAQEIPAYAEKNNFGLIMIATHGRSGISRLVWGSVADRVLRATCIPVLMVKAPGYTPPGH